MADSNIGNEDPKFPGDSMIAPLSENKGPGATQENPGDVHPTTNRAQGQYPPESAQGQQGASIARSIENPYALQEALTSLQTSLDKVIQLFTDEGSTLSNDGSFDSGKAAMDKFRQWREEVEEIKRGKA